MKVSFDLKNDRLNNRKPVSFKGYQFGKDENGFKQFEVSYPFDPKKEDCYLEIYKLDKDQYGNYFTTGKAYTKQGHDSYHMKYGSNKIDLAKTFGIDDNQAFAYHYLLVDKKSNFAKTRVDAGDIIDERSNVNQNRNIFNIVVPSKSGLSRGGAMKLVIIDSQKVGYVYNDQNMIVKDKKLATRGENGIKTIANKFGGTMAGLQHAVDNGEYDGYGRIISLPIFTDDDFTAHAYWNKNCMQIASSLGNINNYASLQRSMFAHGLNFVSDGAFVNEGLEGVHFKHLLKWGTDSPYYNWFKASGLKDGPLSMGVFAKNKDYISHKIVNSPYTYTQNGIGTVSIKKNNPLYDPKKPTYIQFFDTRLVSDNEKNDTTSLIKTYSKMSTDNVFDLHTHNDSIFPYSFEIDPEIYNKNVKRLNEYNDANPDSTIDLKGYRGARLLSKNENFVVDGKFEGGFDTWDANPDIAKLNFVFSNADTKALKNLSQSEKREEMAKILRGNAQVQDYAVTSGQYWTQKTDDILRMYVAQSLKNVDAQNPSQVYDLISRLSNNKVFPKSVKSEVTKAEVENVLDGMYNNKRKLSDEDKRSQIIEGLMNTPLDAIEFGDNLVSVLASPLISKRASVPSEIGVPRYELFKKGNQNLSPEYQKTYDRMENIYTHDMADFAQAVLDNLNSTLPDDKKLFDGEEVTEFGKYVLPILTPAIAKYAVIKSLLPKAAPTIDSVSGEITYDYKKLKEVSLQTLGITNPSCPEEEAEMVLDSMQKGMKHLDSSIDSELVESFARTLKNTNLAGLQLADLIIDKTQSGLDWRIDATKDIADVEALKNHNTTFEHTWKQVSNFWQKFVQGVISKNPNAYTVAEVTDEGLLFDTGYGSKSKTYPNRTDIVPKFLRDTGITATANYSFFFSDVAKIFSKSFEDGSEFADKSFLQRLLFNKMVGIDQDAFIRAGGDDSLKYSYTFIGNHDKPRALHCAAMDMGLFYADLTYKDQGNFNNLKKAYQIVNDKFLENITDDEVWNFDYTAVSPKAVAMADAIRPALINTLQKYRDEYHYSNEEFNSAFIALSKSVADLAQGKFLGKRFDPEAFGIKPFDVSIGMVLKQARQVYGLNLPSGENFENEVFEATMRPAMTKLMGMMKYLVALPGMPTLFDGDDVGATGYDTKTKNMYLQGRQKVHDEWVDPNNRKYKEFIAKYKDEMNDVMKIRKDPRCNALNNGAIYTLPLNKTQSNELVTSIFRQSSDGRMAISIFNPTGIEYDFRKGYHPKTLYLDRLNFSEGGDNQYGISGLKEDTVFVNANDENDIYQVKVDEVGNYYLTRMYDGHPVPTPITDSTLVLYHVPKNGVPLTFTGSCKVKPNTQFVTSAYQNKTYNYGKNLALLSR